MAFSLPGLPVVGETITVAWGVAVRDSLDNLGNVHNHSAAGSTHHGTLDHGDLTVTANQHHNEDHESRHEPGGADAMAVDAAAGTGSLRTIGNGALQLAAGNHVHT